MCVEAAAMGAVRIVSKDIVVDEFYEYTVGCCGQLDDGRLATPLFDDVPLRPALKGPRYEPLRVASYFSKSTLRHAKLEAIRLATESDQRDAQDRQ
jgi:hypothetical protein